MEGRVLGNRYRLYDLVGGGGFGDVYLARDVCDDVFVAVKVLRPIYARDLAAVRRFQREASTARRLKDPHVVRVLDVGREGDAHYLVMEYVQGLTLADLLRQRGPLPIPEAVSYVAQVLRALEDAHTVGIIHRDVKPQNVKVAPGGAIKVMDFGIAKEQDASAQTTPGVYLGTPRYMSPEQARGQHIDARSDLYSATVMLFELLTGRTPFLATDNHAYIRLNAEEPAPSVRNFRGDVPPALADVVAQGLAKDPRDRFPSAAQLRQALETALVPQSATQPLASTAPPIPQAVLGLKRVVPWPTTPVLGVLAFIVVGLSGYVAYSSSFRHASPTPAATTDVIARPILPSPTAPPVEPTVPATSIPPTSILAMAPAPATIASPIVPTSTFEVLSPTTTPAPASTAVATPSLAQVAPSPLPPGPTTGPPTAVPTPPPPTLVPTSPAGAPTSPPTSNRSEPTAALPTATPRPSPTSPSIVTSTAVASHLGTISLDPAQAKPGSVILSWSYSGTLAPDEYFDVRVSPSNPPLTGVANVQQTSYAIGANVPAGDYFWTIAVIRKSGGAITTLVQASQVLRFSWQPASSGSGGTTCPPGARFC